VINILRSVIERMSVSELVSSGIFLEGAPVLSFGNIEKAKIATVGLNPSNLEFFDDNGNELDGSKRRFCTLKSLNISHWSEANENDLKKIVETNTDYFQRSPYDRWFKKLDLIISGTGCSYYFPSFQACHLDLVPFATHQKWGSISNKDKQNLLNISEDILGKILKASDIKVIVLNGESVVDNFKKLSGINYHKTLMPDWELPRLENKGVRGFSYVGEVDVLGGEYLSKKIKILGFNHNLQSSYGVTSEVTTSIKDWITTQLNEID